MPKIRPPAFDVFNNGFWPASWGPRPDTEDEKSVEASARRHMVAWPKLLPLYSHRYLPADPAPLGSPALSVVQTDVIHYGADLVDYLKPSRSRIHCEPRYRYPPWSDFERSPSKKNFEQPAYRYEISPARVIAAGPCVKMDRLCHCLLTTRSC